jgi:hypothetical protein
MIDPYAAADDLVQHNLPREQAERIAFVAWWIDRVGPIRREQLQAFFAESFAKKKTEALTDVFVWVQGRGPLPQPSRLEP